MPGVLGGIAGAISAASATKDRYGETMESVFAAFKDGRTASQQGGFQAATLITTLVIAIVGGLLTGVIVKNFSETKKNLFSDYDDWEVPTEEFVGNVFEGETETLKKCQIEMALE